MWWNHMDGADWWWMSLMMIVFWGLIIGLFVRALRPAATTQQPRRPDPEELLAERFARGEIDEAEYRRSLDTLREHGSTASTGRL